VLDRGVVLGRGSAPPAATISASALSFSDRLRLLIAIVLDISGCYGAVAGDVDVARPRMSAKALLLCCYFFKINVAHTGILNS
jgi:hypothetical protein